MTHLNLRASHNEQKEDNLSTRHCGKYFCQIFLFFAHFTLSFGEILMHVSFSLWFGKKKKRLYFFKTSFRLRGRKETNSDTNP